MEIILPVIRPFTGKTALVVKCCSITIPNTIKRAGSGSATVLACCLLPVSWRAPIARSSNASVLLAGAGLAHASVAASIPCGGISRHQLYLSSSRNYHFIRHCHCFHSTASFFLFRITRIPVASTCCLRGIYESYTLLRTLSLHTSQPRWHNYARYLFDQRNICYRQRRVFTISIVSLQPPSSC